MGGAMEKRSTCAVKYFLLLWVWALLLFTRFASVLFRKTGVPVWFEHWMKHVPTTILTVSYSHIGIAQRLYRCIHAKPLFIGRSGSSFCCLSISKCCGNHGAWTSHDVVNALVWSIGKNERNNINRSIFMVVGRRYIWKKSNHEEGFYYV